LRAATSKSGVGPALSIICIRCVGPANPEAAGPARIYLWRRCIDSF
jgi:hypothetical protein